MTSEAYTAACAWLQRYPYPDDREIGIDELQNSAGAGYSFIARCIAWEWKTYTDDDSRERMEGALSALYVLSDTDPAAGALLGHLYTELHDRSASIPPALELWVTEQVRDRRTRGWEEVLSRREYAKAKARGSLDGIIADAFVYALVEITSHTFDLAVYSGGEGARQTASDAVGAMWRHFGGDHVQSQAAIGKRWKRADERLDDPPWWERETPLDVVGGYVTALIAETIDPTLAQLPD